MKAIFWQKRRLFTFVILAFIAQSKIYSYEYSNQNINYKKISLKSGNDILDLAKIYIGTPYRYGGNNPGGFDCSGLVQYIYYLAGVKLPRKSGDMYRSLENIIVPREGDLVFFQTEPGEISHVGIYAGDFKFLHAPGTGKFVRYADLRDTYWKSRYVGSRKVFP